MLYRKRKQSLSQSTAPVVEQLEERQLLTTWAPAARLIQQDVAAANYPGLTGAGESVAIIDSGVDYNHPSLGGGFGGSHKVEAGWDFMQNDGNPMSDTFAHGTGTAGVLAADPYTYKGLYNRGIAPDVKIIALRQSNSTQVKQALQWVIANRTKYNIVAVNVTDYNGPNGLIYKDEYKQLIAAGVFLSQPSGNSGASHPVGNAMDPADFSVGSVTLSGAMSSFTQRGKELDLLAPGDNVTLPYYDVSSKKHIYVDTADGTSWASPAVVGTAALIKQIDSRFTPLEIMKIMQDSGASVYDSATKLTYKRLNVNAALKLAYERRGGSPQAPDGGQVEVPAGQSAFSGTPIKLSGAVTIQAEDFDNGGENVAFHDVESANLGKNTYRPNLGVDVETGSAAQNGRDVGNIKAGEWLEYTVNVPAAGTFNFSARVASMKAGGKFHLEVDGVDKTGQIGVPDTKAWQTYASVGKNGITLTAGNHVLRFKADSVGSLGYVGNLDSFTLTSTGTAASAPATRSAFSSIAATSYNAQSGTHVNGSYVDQLEQGDYLAYTGIDFGNGSAVRFSANVATLAAYAGRKIQIRTGSATGTIIGTLTIGSTGSWTTFKEQSTTISKVTGVQNVYLTFSGASWIGNIQSFKFA